MFEISVHWIPLQVLLLLNRKYLFSHTHYQVFVNFRTAQTEPTGSFWNRGFPLIMAYTYQNHAITIATYDAHQMHVSWDYYLSKNHYIYVKFQIVHVCMYVRIVYTLIKYMYICTVEMITK